MNKFDYDSPREYRGYKIPGKVHGGRVIIVCPWCDHENKTQAASLNNRGKICEGCGAKHYKGQSYPAVVSKARSRQQGGSAIPGLPLRPGQNVKQSRLVAPGVGLGQEYDQSVSQFLAMATWERSAVVHRARQMGLFEGIDQNWRGYLNLDDQEKEDDAGNGSGPVP